MQLAFLGWLGPAYLAAVAVPLAVIDVRERRLPNKLVLPGFIVVWLAQAVASAASADFWRMGLATLCGLALFALALVANRIGALGMGDVKLLALIGQVFGWWGVWPAALAVSAGILLAAISVLAALALRRINAGSTIPLGPYLLLGCAAETALLFSG